MLSQRSQHFLMVLSWLVLSGCTSPDSYKYKMTPTMPATSSLWHAYTDPLEGGWEEKKSLAYSGVRTNFSLPPAHASTGQSGKTQASEEESFRRYSSVYLKAYKVDVVENYQSSGKEPHIELLLPESPAEATRSWASRFRPTGGQYHLQVIIKDASVISTPLAAPEDKDESPNRRYDGRLEVELRISNHDGKTESSISSVATQSLVIPENASDDDRRALFHRMLMGLIDGVNGELESKIYKNFGPFIDYAKTA